MMKKRAVAAQEARPQGLTHNALLMVAALSAGPAREELNSKPPALARQGTLPGP
eukprot:CAMPEP_0177172076 /NCGR_PEP_ID=MMETSP0367-20130122/10941_1 /TAXON_ID=447022 ORGANISM="Scrippsiella hangoei-like, Strain SHHI-4" /NCGR_SAMPLE_ID=MMETSP0367 /ASSEMBLY_ACC=CAM_ASM_000362 /LENGTH=53 /DNA_ID=CAMNT_0018618321 /DNA_START=38 /DNA_END=199 /DNA_ORIENTATION=+